ncbi:MAG: SDR family oxidoreductase [Thomasclavelia sp.]|jgi:short-subunit dehydrogenase|nr:SDR family oxidoreductase [Thomasclavelia sp.]
MYTLITGASSGIGKALAYRFASAGHNLILIARNLERLNSIKTELEKEYMIDIIVISKDLSLPDSAKEIYEYCLDNELEINVLINNAGFGYARDFISSDIDKQNQLIEVNIKTLMNLTYYFINDMKDLDKGYVLNISSIAATIPGPYMATYYASKAFVSSFSQALSYELKDTNITVCALCPGPVNTNFETSADLIGKGMFKFLKPQEPENVAKVGYKALMKGTVLKYTSFIAYVVSFFARVLPKTILRMIAGTIINR